MRIISVKHCVTVCLLCVFAAMAGGCNKANRQTYPDACIGVLYSADSGGRSAVEWYDSELNCLGTAYYPFSGASVTQTNARIQNGTVFLAPAGEEQKKDYGKIALINPAKGSFEEIITNRVNQYDCAVEEPYLALTSNLNGECFVDLINIYNKEIRTLKLQNKGVICTQPVLINGEVYASATDGEKYFLCKCDFTGNGVDSVTELPDELSTYLEKHGNDLAFVSQGRLVKYNTITKETEYIELSYSNALNLNVAGDTAWIAYTNPFDENAQSRIEARDYDTGKVICGGDFDGAILQMEADDSRLFVRTYDELIDYSFANGKLIQQHRMRCEKNGHYYCGFFYLNGK